jgi:L-threonine kinase
VQGAIDGVSFLVACPIDWYSAVSVALRPQGSGVIGPDDSPKAIQAAIGALNYLGRHDLGGRLSITSSLPRGKGMGSSTADVAGAIFAVARALGQPISDHTVGDLALAVEPSDGSMFPNITLFDHRYGRKYEELGVPPPIDVAVLDFGGTVDTVAFNLRDWSSSLSDTEPMTTEALLLVRRGIREGRVDLIGRAATLSGEANQRILFKVELEAVIELARELGAAGVNVGHSGTVIGVLSDPHRLSAGAVLRVARERFPHLVASYSTRLVGGGCRGPVP